MSQTEKGGYELVEKVPPPVGTRLKAEENGDGNPNDGS